MIVVRRPGRDEAGGSNLVLSVPDHGGLVVTRRAVHADEVAGLDLVRISAAARDGEVAEGWQSSAPVLVVTGASLAEAIGRLAPLQVRQDVGRDEERPDGDVLVLPSGLVYGRVEPALAPAVLAAVAEDRVLADHLRGRSHLTAPLQVSEVALRRAARAAADRGARLVASDASDLPGTDRTAGHRTTSVWQVGAASWRVVVDTVPGAPPAAHTVVEVTDAAGPGRGARVWDQRYLEGAGRSEPHPAVVETATTLVPGTALDLACGTGRHALWLAENGWDVTALDFSRVGVESLQRTASGRGLMVEAQVGDARAWTPPDGAGYDLVLLSFVHLPEVLARATRWVAPGGRLLVVGHSASTPIGVGPSDLRLRLDRVDLAARVTGARLRVLRAAEVARDTVDGPTTDVVLVAVRP